MAEKVGVIDWEHGRISLSRQAQLLGMARSSLYYLPRRSPQEVNLTRRIDEIYLEYPFYGSRKIRAELLRRGEDVGRERVRKLMRKMGIVALGPKPFSSRPHPEHQIYPYLLRGVPITHVHQVWSTDMTSIRLTQGWLYLVAIMDWFSRYVLSWKLSMTLEVEFCIAALEEALQRATPEIFNSDQGAQFTSPACTSILLQQEVRMSMDGRGRVFDNIFQERLWRSVKYEEVYVHEYDSVKTATHRIGNYVDLYNNRRLHEALGYVPPAEIYHNAS